MIEDQPGDRVASGTGARLGEDRLQVVLDSLRRHARPAGDLLGGQTPCHQLGDPALAVGEAIGIDHQGCYSAGRAASSMKATGESGPSPISEPRTISH